jgi:hypothetical protein
MNFKREKSRSSETRNFDCIQYKKKGTEHGGKSDQFSEKVWENPQKKRKTKIISELGL